jgi:O-acetyl-ADP-ribose deacetylase (regulator of RNase III)
MEVSIGDKVIRFVQGDITVESVDAIVNAANPSLMGGGGVDGAIHRAGGPAILEECRQIVARQGACPTGQAVITTGGRLPTRHVIHTVGPIWRGGGHGEDRLLASAYRESLALAAARGLSSVAFPSISTGVYGYPVAEAARVAVETVMEHLRGRTSVKEVRFVLFDRRTYEAYIEAAKLLNKTPENGDA